MKDDPALITGDYAKENQFFITEGHTGPQFKTINQFCSDQEILGVNDYRDAPEPETNDQGDINSLTGELRKFSSEVNKLTPGQFNSRQIAQSAKIRDINLRTNVTHAKYQMKFN